MKRSRPDLLKVEKLKQEVDQASCSQDLTRVVEFDDDNDVRKGKLSKREMKEARLAKNKTWSMVERKVGSGIDPNPRHTLYYKAQFPDEFGTSDGWEAFQKCLNEPLCVTFRVGACCPPIVRESITREMAHRFAQLQGRFFVYNDKVIRDKIVEKICWTRAWQLCCDSQTLLREPALQSLSDYLTREVDLGHCCRQELSSMVPVLFLDVQPHHKVLDVCAAPGSKSEQLLSLVSASKGGLVVANDADSRRIKTLRGRFRRYGAPHVVITCSRAEDLSRKLSSLKMFDRVVADVPCSGDGTIRKFPHIWRNFRPRFALELHPIQLQIAISAVKMLRPGGRFVYSTCSLNPLEDEAVVSGMLREFAGRLSLVSASIPGLKTRQGLTSWQFSEEVFSIGEKDEQSRKSSRSRLPELQRSMFPPSSEESFHLERCHRIMPHDQDLGGFFVAILELAEEEGNVDNNSQIMVPKEKSEKVMKQLGYNPATSSPLPSKFGSYTPACEKLSRSLLSKSAIDNGFSLVQSNVSRSLKSKQSRIEHDEQDQVTSHHYPSSERNESESESDGEKSEDQHQQYLSMVTPSALKLLFRLQAAKKIEVEQVGVEICSFLNDEPRRYLADNARALALFSNLPVFGVSSLVFRQLCQHGSQKNNLPLTAELAGILPAELKEQRALIVIASMVDAKRDSSDYGTSTNVEQGKRRLSKAEKKRKSKDSQSTQHDAQVLSAPLTPAHDQSNGIGSDDDQQMVLVIQGDSAGQFFILTAQDMCNSFSDALSN